MLLALDPTYVKRTGTIVGPGFLSETECKRQK